MFKTCNVLDYNLNKFKTCYLHLPLQTILCTPKCRIIMNYIRRFPCPVLSSWIQPTGSTNKRSKKEKRINREIRGQFIFLRWFLEGQVRLAASHYHKLCQLSGHLLHK